MCKLYTPEIGVICSVHFSPKFFSRIKKLNLSQKMTRYCVICKIKQKSGVSGVSLFRFPQRGNDFVLNKWKSAAGFPISYSPNNSECICSSHFKANEIVKSGDGSKMFPANASIFPTINIFTKTRNYLLISTFFSHLRVLRTPKVLSQLFFQDLSPPLR